MTDTKTELIKPVNIFSRFLLLPTVVKIILALIVPAAGWFVYQNVIVGATKKVTYQTTAAVKDTLVTTVSASGSVSSGGSVAITTGVTGMVNQVYVKNGDTVTQGEKIADITLDRDSQQKQAQAWASYLSAQNQLNSAQASLFSLQSSLYSKWKIYTDLAENSTYTNGDGSPNSSERTLPAFTTVQDDWFSAEANYKNQQSVIAQTQAAITSSYYNYQLLSSTITAPESGTVQNMTIAAGVPLFTQSSSSNSNSVVTQQVGTVNSSGVVLAVVNLSEIDAGSVTPGQKVTMTLDAFPNKTFTGKVLVINTNGAVSSGVTTYPATIGFDTAEKNMYPNMAVDAQIITSVKDNAILVPSGAIQTANGQSTVRVMNKNGQVSTVPVEIGGSNDTQTEITSGVNEGDEIVTGTTGGTSATTSTGGASVFSALGGRGGAGGFGGGGGAVRVATGR